MNKLIQGAADNSIWRVSGNYPDGGTFTDCLAIVLPAFTHGTDETLLQMLPPLRDLIGPENVTKAQIVVEDPWAAGPLYPASEIILIANETSDSQGNLYRIDFINRIQHDIELHKETSA